MSTRAREERFEILEGKRRGCCPWAVDAAVPLLDAVRIPRDLESLQVTLDRREPPRGRRGSGGESSWRGVARSGEQELAAAEAQIRKVQGAPDRYFQAFEEGRLREEVCTRRIEELSGKLTSLEARAFGISPRRYRRASPTSQALRTWRP